MKSLKDKFQVIDSIFPPYGLFLTELEIETPTMKKFVVKTLKNNSEKIEELGEKVNGLIRSKEFGEIDQDKLKQYSVQMDALSKELEETAKIVCTLHQDHIKIQIIMKEEMITFKFKEEDYLDPLVDYLKNNLGQKLLSR